MVKKKKESKKQVRNKKLTKKELEEFAINIKFAKDNLDNRKRVYDRYIKVLVEYGIKDIAYSAIGYDELLNKALLVALKKAVGDPNATRNLIFGDWSATELDRTNKNIKYYDSLIEHARDKIQNFTHPIKTKIAKDAIEKRHAWLNIPE